MAAGISAADEPDAAVLYERLVQELSAGSPNGSGAAGARQLAERFWPVSADRPLGGGAKGLVKRVLRKLMRWYVEPLAADQRVFNDSTLKLLDALSERVDESAANCERIGRLARELEERFIRFERRGRLGSSGAPATVAAQPSAAALPDYFSFESRMRGGVEAIRERQRPYVDVFRTEGPVLDIGCGRGELVRLLTAAGVDARGVDSDADMVTYAQNDGHRVEQADTLSYLEGLAARLYERFRAST